MAKIIVAKWAALCLQNESNFSHFLYCLTTVFIPISITKRAKNLLVFLFKINYLLSMFLKEDVYMSEP